MSCVLSASSLLSRVLAVVVFLTVPVIFCCYVNLLLQVISCIILEMFTKDVLLYMSCSIHSCPWLQLWSSLACDFRALRLLQNVSWQIVYMLFNLAKDAIVDPCML